jgi:outer membrane protein assembly factor BamA
MSLVASATLGTKLREVEGTFHLPEWLLGRVVSLDLTGLYRLQDTPRFGELETIGGTLSATRVLYQHQRTETTTAKTLSASGHYDFRRRSRNVDALRAIGADMDETQVAVSTTTGSLGATLEFENRVNREGQISPLAPEGGWRAELTVSYADPHFSYFYPFIDHPLGRDQFLKVSGAVSKFYSVPWSFFVTRTETERKEDRKEDRYLVVRADVRFDQGFPFGGAVLLPEVERYFAGGDGTVRGYSEDRLATELIQVAVPPLDNVTQIRVIPAGGDIRVLGSLDAQLRIWKILAGAVFTDVGMITNRTEDLWDRTTADGIKPSVGMGLRALTPFGIGALEYAVPLRPQLGDDPRGRIHFYFAARAQF